MVKFSIIIPMYNSEKYITKCIDSIIESKCNSYEIIIIDDNSTDNSVELCRKYNNKNIKIITNVGSGVSSARNTGIKESIGEYIIFIDSDDYITKDIMSYIDGITKENKYDIFISRFLSVKENDECRDVVDKLYDQKKIDNKTTSDVVKYLYQKRMIFTVWRFVIKRKIIIDNNLYFIENIVHEDEEWVPRMLLSSKTFRFIPFEYYIYRIHPSSITSNLNMNNYLCYLKVSQLLVEYSIKENIKYKKLFYQRCAYKNASLAYFGIRKISKPMREI